MAKKITRKPPKRRPEEPIILRILKIIGTIILGLIALGGLIGAIIHYYQHVTSK